jgi:predicted transcriptional regulator YdeE
MAYVLKQVTIKTDNTTEGIKKIDELWQDILTGNLPILFDSEQVFQEGIIPISKYSNYASDENGVYDLSIIGVVSDFIQILESKVELGQYKKYDITDESNDLSICAKKAWEKVWNDKKSGLITRTYTEDYESNVPAEYSADGKAHCYLYIAI